MVSSVLDTSAYQWGIHSKFSFEVGLENPFFGTDKNQGAPQIIWFKQGIYVCTSYSSSISTNGYTINLQGKDKMCLLNGDVGGALPALSTDFDKVEEISYSYEPIQVSSETWRPGEYYIASGDDYILDESSGDGWREDITYYKQIMNSTQTKIWIGDIIKELVHVYGNEPYHNIIIQDIEQNGVELWEYRGDKTMYMIVRKSTNEVENIVLDDEMVVFPVKWDETTETYQRINEKGVTLYALSQDDNFKFLVLNTLDAGSDFNEFSLVEDPFNNTDALFLMKFSYGDLIGYHATPLVYPGDLKGTVGASITSILDNITKTFGNYEYFYDLDGHFIFQKKRSQIQTEALGLAMVASKRSERNVNGALKSDIIFNTELMQQLQSYNYQNSELFTQMSITPQITKIKNDYSVWGTRPSVNGSNVPVHYRFAISEKPQVYTSIRPGGATYRSNEVAGNDGYDWRELIYQMAEDYYHYSQDDDFLARVAQANPDYYPTGYTGYEPFYQDMQAFWRQIYLPEDEWVMERVEVDANNFSERKNQLYTVNTEGLEANYVRVGVDQGYEPKTAYYCPVRKQNQSTSKWHVDVFDNPTAINYWLDFCDEGEMAKFSIQRLGDRAKAVNDAKVKSIYYEEAPNVLFVYIDEDYDKTMTGYTPLLINRSMEEMFKVSSMGKNAKEALTTLLNDNAFISESVSITSVPIYYLDVNTKIEIVDNERGINGDYLVSKLTVPLTYNGTMSITATKVVNTIY